MPPGHVLCVQVLSLIQKLVKGETTRNLDDDEESRRVDQPKSSNIPAMSFPPRTVNPVSPTASSNSSVSTVPSVISSAKVSSVPETSEWDGVIEDDIETIDNGEDENFF